MENPLKTKYVPSISVIVPTYKEAENLPLLIARIKDVRETRNLDLEMLIMDDDSQDGTVELIDKLKLDWVKLHVRIKDRGLSFAVIDGMQRARNDVLVVMDADLSHPPEKIPELVQALEDGFDFALGSRYVGGGSTSDDWGLFRWLNSRIATLLALPFTTLKDPMSGFFAIRRETFINADQLNPVGYKIGLEILVKGKCRKSTEIPIHFENRKFGESKLTLTEQLKYIKHIRRLFTYKYGTWSHLLQFLIVGGLGMFVNLAALTALLSVTIDIQVAIGLAIAISMVFNFVLNRRFTFSYAREGSVIKHFFGFISACAIGALVNYGITVKLLELMPTAIPQLAAVFGIAAGSILNFLFNRFAVFKYEHYKDQ